MGAAEDEEYLSEEGSPVIPPPVKQISRFSNMGTEEDSRDDSRDDNEYRYVLAKYFCVFLCACDCFLLCLQLRDTVSYQMSHGAPFLSCSALW